MPIYSRKISIAANDTKTEEIDVEGDYLTYFRLRFPPGPRGLVKVALFYGIKQILPYEESTWFYGDNEIITWEGLWSLPEERTTLKVKCVNEDNTYPHSVYVIIKTEYVHDMWIYKLARMISTSVRRMLGWL